MRLVPGIVMLAGAVAVAVALQGGIFHDLGDVARRLVPLAALAALLFAFPRNVVTTFLFAAIVAGALVPPYAQGQGLSLSDRGLLFGAVAGAMLVLLVVLDKVFPGATRRRNTPLFLVLFALSSWTAGFVVYDAGNLVLGAYFGALGVSAAGAGIYARRSAAALAALRDGHAAFYWTLLAFGALYGNVGIAATVAAAVLPLGAWTMASLVAGTMIGGDREIASRLDSDIAAAPGGNGEPERLQPVRQ